MLDQNDLEVLQKMMETVVDSRIAETEKRMDSRMAESEKRMDLRIAESENMILEEIDRVQTILENRINTVKENLEERKQYYRITKLENDNTALLLKMIDELSKRVEELEKKTA